MKLFIKDIWKDLRTDSLKRLGNLFCFIILLSLFLLAISAANPRL